RDGRTILVAKCTNHCRTRSITSRRPRAISRGRRNSSLRLSVDGRMTGGFFSSEKNASVDSGAPLIVLYHRELEKTHAKVVNLGGEITKEIFQFPGGRRFHFREPGGGEFSVWSDR